MINNVAHEMGMLAISFSRAEEVVPFIAEAANRLGISVAEGQTGEIHRAQRDKPCRCREGRCQSGASWAWLLKLG